jgi:superfamily II DNA or RNA helicase/HKD family nuclease
MAEPLRPGLYELLVTRAVEERLRASAVIPPDPLDGRSASVLGRHVGQMVERALLDMQSAGIEERQVEFVNELVARIRAAAPEAFDGDQDDVIAPARELAEVSPGLTPGGELVRFERPTIPLADSALLVNGRGEPTIGNELNRELASADGVDVLIPFIRWSGVRIVIERLAQVCQRKGRVRVIASTYLASSEARALERLVDIGAEVRVSYDTDMTRLHAKAWLLERQSGFSTAFIGSSNLSRTALVDGLEWNVRLSEVDTPSALRTFRTAFESYWNDRSVEPYDAERFGAAIRAEKRAGLSDSDALSGLEITARPFQQRILEALEVERARHDQHRNLVVAATGTGKTVIAALDYHRLRTRHNESANGPYRLLFVAHRQEILRQARRTFREVEKSGAFGELYVAGERPDVWDYVFASVQGLATLDLDTVDPRYFNMIIVDEFHHSAAPTYRRLLEHFDPDELLGLTATPERTDGQERAMLDTFFAGRFAAELRLWDAIDEGMLCPFQYFGVHDDVDLSKLRWSRGRYDTDELATLYTGNDARTTKVLSSLRDIVTDPNAMRALGFCVSVAHAEYMAAKFNEAGIPAKAVSGETSSYERANALEQLRSGEINCVFAVDLLNEGVDIPTVDTVLFLRPTESATVFLQQLGRGLRRIDGKACLTVLDFIGNQNRKFRFDQRYRALLPSSSTAQLTRQIEEDFPFLPSGCFMTLDRVARDVVLRNVQTAIRGGWREMADELRGLGDVTLGTYLRESQREVWELYRSSPRGSISRQGWQALRRAAGLSAAADLPRDDALIRAIGRMTHVQDPERTRVYLHLLRAGSPPPPASLASRDQRLLAMLYFDLWGAARNRPALEGALTDLWERPAVRDELIALLEELDAQADLPTLPLAERPDVPLAVHGIYTREEVTAAMGIATTEKPVSFREGVRWDPENNADLFFVTLDKDEKRFSAETRYKDAVLSPRLLQWESQNRTSQASPTGQRYISHGVHGSHVLFFIRQQAGDSFLFAGPARYVSHEGDRPIRFKWMLDTPLPVAFFERVRAVA